MAYHQVERRSAILRVRKTEVTFVAGGRSYTQPTGGPTLAAQDLLRLVEELPEDWHFSSPGHGYQADDAPDTLKQAGQALGMSFLEGPAGLALSRELSAAKAAGTQLWLAIDASEDF